MKLQEFKDGDCMFGARVRKKEKNIKVKCMGGGGVWGGDSETRLIASILKQDPNT